MKQKFAQAVRILTTPPVFSALMCTLLHFKASGHTCGCSGPIAALSIFINPWFLVGYVLLTPIIWSSIRLKRHTALQLLAGCVIPVLAMLICRAQFL